MFNFLKKDNFNGSVVKDMSHWQWMTQQNPFTPDICHIEKSPYKLVFFGDDIKRNRENFDLLEGQSEVLSSAITHEHYNFLIKCSDGTPFALNSSQEEEFISPSLQKFAPARRILGELHKVPSWLIPKLDNHRQNGVQFRRIRSRFIIYYRDDKRPHANQIEYVNAYMYVAAPPYWASLINGGASIRCVPIIEPREKLPWLPEYYTYPKNGMLPDLNKRVKRR